MKKQERQYRKSNISSAIDVYAFSLIKEYNNTVTLKYADRFLEVLNEFNILKISGICVADK